MAGKCPNDLPLSCPVPAPSYADDVAPILHERCVPCHYGTFPLGLVASAAVAGFLGLLLL